jgi:GTP-binding protein
VVAPAEHAGRAFLCIDTGGFSADAPREKRVIPALVRQHTLAAIAEADCVVCVFDGAAGLAPEDRDTVALLRRSGKPVLYVVNKIDTAGREGNVVDFHAIGIERLLAVSAAHDRGRREPA